MIHGRVYSTAWCSIPVEKPVEIEEENRRGIVGLPECCLTLGSATRLDQNIAFPPPIPSSKMHRCTSCEYVAISPSALAIHLRVHTGEKPFSCTLCEYRAASKSHLTRHMRTHTGEKPFPCTLCEFWAAHKSDLTSHMRRHMGEKPYSCTLCEYRAARKSDLTAHMKRHTGEKPYSCTLCEYRAAQKGHLTRHMKTHTGEKPYVCTLCEYRTAHKSHLTAHMKTHSNLPAGGECSAPAEEESQDAVRIDPTAMTCTPCGHQSLNADAECIGAIQWTVPCLQCSFGAATKLHEEGTRM
jgi:uncharacterized Zn-finger protein